ncbi:MAG: glyoxalase/bleomycin resistance/extradiol dioxygenase family protein [Saprospiraceae bacterium]|nr:glyoxalase/bleomycin resistance/extradiol dioxygenase family protein [Candidatus Defluviibacterium haderslevense]
MATKVFINLPVKDVEKSKFFFSQLGYHIKEQISDNLAACIIISENIFVMLLKEEYFRTLIQHGKSELKTYNEVLISLDAGSKLEIQNIIHKAQQMGALIYAEPQNHGWMYQHCFADLDGHHWEFIFTDKDLLPDYL